ncbi:phage holin family protein [Halomonas chromatireducens]|uniref:Inner membrane protein YqjE n=1 Tax=Halomonas chromatireducens TaxID=507626 RepID=A0A109UME3_9GAMM|nr:phage holin family protein [Halomonas chromatireducens]AMD01692.1 Inner membrane protein YqjE [Halomonas chromatireducens]
MESSQGPVQRLFSAGKRLLNSLLAVGETRLRLVVLELEEEKARLFTLLLLSGLSLLLMLLGLGMLMLLVVVFFWDTHRLAAITISAAVLLGGGLLLALLVIRQARRHTLLKDTLAQLATDRNLMNRDLVESTRDEPRR